MPLHSYPKPCFPRRAGARAGPGGGHCSAGRGAVAAHDQRRTQLQHPRAGQGAFAFTAAAAAATPPATHATLHTCMHALAHSTRYRCSNTRFSKHTVAWRTIIVVHVTLM